jgi:inhibitor of KinA
VDKRTKFKVWCAMTISGARIFPLGDSACVIELGDEIGETVHSRVAAVVEALESQPPEAMVEYIPAFTTVTVIYDPIAASGAAFSDRLVKLLSAASEGAEVTGRPPVEVPVCYGGDLGPDLEFVASHNGLQAKEVIEIHSEKEYLVYMIGFAPGFPYLGGMSERIAAPRQDSPRPRIPAGSVGIAGRQTGIYSIESPGGWQLIGQTPQRLFRPGHEEPSLLRTGDRVRFKAIDRTEFNATKGQMSP